MVNKDNKGLVLPLRVEYEIIDNVKKSLAKRPWEYLEEGNYEKYLKLSEKKKDVSTHRKELIDKQNHVNLQFVDPKFDLVKHDFKCICKNTLKFRYSLELGQPVDAGLSKQKTTKLKEVTTREFDVEVKEIDLRGLDESDKHEKTVIVSSRADSEVNEPKDPAVEKYFDTSILRTGTKIERTGTTLMKRASTVMRGGTNVFDKEPVDESKEKSQTKVKFDVTEDVKSYDHQSNFTSEAVYKASVSRNYDADKTGESPKIEPDLSKKLTYNSEYLMQLPSLDIETLHANKQVVGGMKRPKKGGGKKHNERSKDDSDGKSKRVPMKAMSGSGERSEKPRQIIGEKMDKKPSGGKPRLNTFDQAIVNEKISHQEAEMKNDLMHLLETVPVFSDLPRSRLVEISKHFKLRSYFTNSSIILAGEFPQEFVIVASGTVSSYKYESNTLYNVYQRSYLSSDYFGEQFLMNNTASDEFFIADSHVTVQTMNANTFKTLLSDLFDSFRYRLKEFTNYGACRVNTIAVPSRFFTNVEIDKFASNEGVVKAHRVITSGLVEFLSRYPFLAGFKNLEKLARRFSYHEYRQKEILEGLGKKENLFLVHQGVVSLQVYEEELNSQLELIAFQPGSYFLTCKFNSDVVSSLMERVSFVAKEKLVLLCLEHKHVAKYLRGSVDQMVLYLENLYKSKYLKLEKSKYKTIHAEKIDSSETDSQRSHGSDQEKSNDPDYAMALSRNYKTTSQGFHGSDSESSGSHSSDDQSDDRDGVAHRSDTQVLQTSPVSGSEKDSDESRRSGSVAHSRVVSRSASLTSEAPKSLTSFASRDAPKSEQKTEAKLYEPPKTDESDNMDVDMAEDEPGEVDESSGFSSSSISESVVSSGKSSGKYFNDDTSSIQSSSDDTSGQVNDEGSTLYSKDSNTVYSRDSSGDVQSKQDTGSSKNDTATQHSKQDSESLHASSSSLHDYEEEEDDEVVIHVHEVDSQELKMAVYEEKGKMVDKHGSFAEQPGLTGVDDEHNDFEDDDEHDDLGDDEQYGHDDKQKDFGLSVDGERDSNETHQDYSRGSTLKDGMSATRSFEKQPSTDSFRSSRQDSLESSKVESFKSSHMETLKSSHFDSYESRRMDTLKSSHMDSLKSSRVGSSRFSDFGERIVSRRSLEDPAEVSIKSSSRTDLESSRPSEFERIVSRRSMEDPADVSIKTSSRTDLESSRSSEFERIVSRRSMEDPAEVSIKSSSRTDLESSRFSDFGAKIVSRRSFEDPAEVSIKSSSRTDLESSRSSEFERIVSRRSMEDPAEVSIKSSSRTDLQGSLDSGRTLSSSHPGEFQPVPRIANIHETVEEEARDMENEQNKKVSDKFSSDVRVSRSFSSKSLSSSQQYSPRGERKSSLTSGVGQESVGRTLLDKTSPDKESFDKYTFGNESIDKASVQDQHVYDKFIKKITQDYEMIRKNTLLASHVNISDTEISSRSQKPLNLNEGKQATEAGESDELNRQSSGVEELVQKQTADDDGIPQRQSSFMDSIRGQSSSLKESSQFGKDSKDSDVSSVASDVRFIFNLDKLNKAHDRQQHSGEDGTGTAEGNQSEEKPDSSRVMGNDNFVDIRSLSYGSKISRGGTNLAVSTAQSGSSQPISKEFGKLPSSTVNNDNLPSNISYKERSQMSDRVVHRQTSSSYLITSRTLNESFDPNEQSGSYANDRTPSYLNENESVPTDKYGSSFEENEKHGEYSSKPSSDQLSKLDKHSSALLKNISSMGSKHDKSSLASQSRKSSIESIISKSYPGVEESINSVLETMRTRSMTDGSDKSMGGVVEDGPDEVVDKSPSLDFAEVPNLTKIISRVHSLYVSPELQNRSVSGSKFSSIDEVYVQLDKIEKMYPGKSPSMSISPKSSMERTRSNELDKKSTESSYVKSVTKQSLRVDSVGDDGVPLGEISRDSDVQSDFDKLRTRSSYSSLNALTNLYDSEQNRDDSFNTNQNRDDSFNTNQTRDVYQQLDPIERVTSSSLKHTDTSHVKSSDTSYLVDDNNEKTVVKEDITVTDQSGDSKQPSAEVLEDGEVKSQLSFDSIVDNLSEHLSISNLKESLSTSSLTNDLSIGTLTRDLSIENLTRGISMDTLSEHLSLENITRELSNIGSSISSQLSGAFSSKSSENNEVDEEKHDVENETGGFSFKETSKLIITSIFDNIPLYSDKDKEVEAESAQKESELSEEEYEVKDVKKEVEELLSDKNVFIDKYKLVSRISFDSSSPATLTSFTDKESVEGTEKSGVTSSQKQSSLRSDRSSSSRSDREESATTSVSGDERNALRTPVVGTDENGSESSLSSVKLKQDPRLITSASSSLTSESARLTSENTLLTSENEDKFSTSTMEKEDKDSLTSSERTNMVSVVENDDKDSSFSSERANTLVSSESSVKQEPPLITSGSSSLTSSERPESDTSERESDRASVKLSESHTDNELNTDKTLDGSLVESVNDTSNLSTDSESHISSGSYNSSEEKANEYQSSVAESNEDGNSVVSLTSENTYTSRKTSSIDSRTSSMESFDTKTSSMTPSGDGLESRSSSLESRNSRAGDSDHSRQYEGNEGSRTESMDNNLESSEQNEEGSDYENGTEEDGYEHHGHYESDIKYGHEHYEHDLHDGDEYGYESHYREQEYYQHHGEHGGYEHHMYPHQDQHLHHELHGHSECDCREHGGYHPGGGDKVLRYDSDRYNHNRADKFGHYRGESLEKYDEEEEDDDEDFDEETVDSDEEEDYEYDEETILSIKNLLMSTLKNKYKSLGASFVAMDYERTGKVAREVFLGFIEKLGIGAIDHREQNLMFELLKQDGEEYITFSSFYSCSGESISSVAELNQHLVSIYGSSRLAFERFFSELKKSTKCTKVDFVAIMSQAGIGEERALRLFDQLDVCKTGTVTVFTMLKMIVGDWEEGEAREYEEKLNTNLSRLLTYLSPDSAEDFNNEFTRTLSSHFFDQGPEGSLVTSAYEEFYLDRDLKYLDPLSAILDEHKEFRGISLAQKRFIVSLFNIVDTSFGLYQSSDHYSSAFESTPRDQYSSEEAQGEDDELPAAVGLFRDGSGYVGGPGYVTGSGNGLTPDSVGLSGYYRERSLSGQYGVSSQHQGQRHHPGDVEQGEAHDVTLISSSEPDPPLVALLSGSLETKFDGFTYPKSVTLSSPCLANYEQMLSCIDKFANGSFREGANDQAATGCGYTISFKVGAGMNTVVGIMPMTSYLYNVVPLLEERRRKLPVILQFLKCVQSFSAYTAEELERIAGACTVKQYKLHETVARAGESPTHFYVIFDGSLTVNNDYNFELKCLSKADLFSSYDIVNNKPNSFTLNANYNLVLLSWERNEFFRVFTRYATLVDNDACNLCDPNDLTLQKTNGTRVSFADFT
ncbi:hypothetical protein MACK_001363 [Theileria orientalis]|uniref:Cyclic nucleotide-binding domain-containing protein n=1 Tax=Theileria orientalis TaxID=68886 RepID=A0A976MCT7_THEOR|nr:hypothetical protein MACK_001363 [Theileria orientalis]